MLCLRRALRPQPDPCMLSCMLPCRSGHKHILMQANMSTIPGKLDALVAVVNITRLMRAMAKHLPQISWGVGQSYTSRDERDGVIRKVTNMDSECEDLHCVLLDALFQATHYDCPCVVVTPCVIRSPYQPLLWCTGTCTAAIKPSTSLWRLPALCLKRFMPYALYLVRVMPYTLYALCFIPMLHTFACIVCRVCLQEAGAL